ncbi:hypothetical protein RhiirA1_491260 [Rhizophagus irregularis]|uniref:Ubiquitin-like domain-containing protein n=1 Tax=Rhizophagus irregularis TaxID=588596 RepID=A0A2N0RA00_9GLOM|nr:hypothetical protein RhiirA1_491260 [Rhizophagus irregularis]
MTSLNEWIDMKIKDGNIDYVEYGEFSNVEKVGEGAFGIINSAYWGSCGIKIAIKALINNSSVDKNIMDEFVKELKNLKKVSFHPNINGFFGISKGESSPRHKPNGFAEEALKNVDVDVLTLKDCVENATFDNLRINDTIVNRKNYEGKVETTRNINTTDGNNKTEEIYVVLLNGQKYAFQYNQVKNISELRKEIKKKLSVDEESKQKLIYKGVELQDQVITPCTLQYYEIEPGSHIQLIIVLYTESIKSLIFDSFWGYPANGTQDYLEGSCLLYIGDVLFRKYDYISAFYPSFPHIKHSGALMDNTNKRGHQRITAKLDKLPPEITQLYFVLSSFKSPTIGHFKAPSFKLIDETQPEPLCSYQLEQAAESQAIIICCISRVGQEITVYKLCHYDLLLTDSFVSHMTNISFSYTQ